jgi:hypothetical protein
MSYPRKGCIRIRKPGCFMRDDQTLAEAVDFRGSSGERSNCNVEAVWLTLQGVGNESR